ncbi:MAG: alpha/beta hydrolase [Alphaproteobacteria bacterium]
MILILCGCQSITPPPDFIYQEIQTDSYQLASWQKKTDPLAPVRIYIEGDGYAFNYAGQPTSNPTPRGTFLRRIAFNDPNPNVVYLARPCQYVKDTRCSLPDWTTGRFAPEIVMATVQAIKTIAPNQPVILIGYSGGALLSGLVIEQTPDLSVQQWITLAGVLNHTKWTQGLKLPPLTHSLDLEKLPRVKQLHLVGDKDETVSYQLTASLVAPENLIVIPDATHSSGFEHYDSVIYKGE